MAPKAAPPPEPVAELVAEEEEEGEGNIAFRLSLGGVSNLPCELETCVAFSGLCRENRSNPAEASEAPPGFELTKDKFIKQLGQTLSDEVVSTDLVVSLRDVARDNAVIGEAKLSCLSLLHLQNEVGGELTLTLTEAYQAKWFPDAEEEKEPDKGAAKAKGKAKAKAEPAKEASPIEEKKKTTRPPGWTPPATTIEVRVRVDELVGPSEDRQSWNTLTINLKGAFGMPERLASVGVTGPDDIESHQLKYRAVVFGEELGAGVLTKPAEVEEVPEPAEGEEAPPPAEELPEDQLGRRFAVSEELSEEAWREREQRFGRCIRFNDGQPIVRYRGESFLKEFRDMLNNTGGVWLYFDSEEKPSTDPKKPNSPEVGPLSKHFVGKAWLDLRNLIWLGTRATEAICPLISTTPAQDVMQGESTLQDARAFVVIGFELAFDAASPPEPAVADLRTLIPPHKAANKFSSSSEAVQMYGEAVERCWSNISKDCSSGPTPQGVAGIVERLKKTGSYTDLKEDIRSAVVQIFRERLRKDTTAIPGRPLEGEQRDALISGTYTYLKRTAVEVLDDLRASDPEPCGIVGESTTTPPDTAESREGRPTPQKLPPKPQVTLQETVGAENARQALRAAVDVAGRNARLAFESELLGNWDRAADLMQSRLLLEEVRSEPKEWVAFAKFCARSRGRQAAAEEALRQAVDILADGTTVSPPEVGEEVDLMLACLLLDRGRQEEAVRVFRELREKDVANPIFSFLLGLSLFLSGDDGVESKPLFESVSKTRQVEPYVTCLEKLLDFGLPSLAFTFLDQCCVLPKEALEKEPLALIDAKASALDQDFAAALARCEQLTPGGAGIKAVKGSQETWRLKGECLYQLGDMDGAKEAYDQAMLFESKFEEPAVYIRLGAVLVAKKRWKQAREAFLKSVKFLPTAEAWYGTAYVEYRSDELQPCHEALCEASLLDNERADIWALMTLVHLRLENWLQADQGFKQCLSLKGDCEELLVEVSAEYCKCVAGDHQAAYAEQAARRAMAQKDTPQARAALVDALEKQGKDSSAEQWPN